MEAPGLLSKLAFQDYLHLKEVQPGVHAYGRRQAMNRVRAYTTAGLGPFASRPGLQEVLLVGHVHLDATKRITLVEGFNGQEGEQWAKRAYAESEKAGALAEGAQLKPTQALVNCVAARNPR